MKNEKDETGNGWPLKAVKRETASVAGSGYFFLSGIGVGRGRLKTDRREEFAPR